MDHLFRSLLSSAFCGVFLKSFFNDLFLFREMGRVGAREGEKHQCVRDTLAGCLSHAPNQGPGLQPRHVP